jgi:GT2 family glycosyltransferase
MKFSVLICTYNRPELLGQCLDALIYRTTEKPDQVVVVNGGDERTDILVEGRRQKAENRDQRSAVRDQRQGTEIKLVKTINKNLAASRNVGLPHCTGDIIAMTDDDAEVFPDWVTQMKRLHAEHPEAGAVGGPVIGADSDSFISRLADQVTFNSPASAQYVRTLPGVNISYKHNAVEEVGPQDETLFRGEDVDYNWRVKRLGYEIYYDPSVRVLHHHRPSLRTFLNQHYMYGRAYYLVRSKWPEMYCVYPHGLRRPKDVLKTLNFVAAPFYEPAQYAARLKRIADWLPAYPILLANQLAWRGGMFRQMLLGRSPEQTLSHGYAQINTDREVEENGR